MTADKFAKKAAGHSARRPRPHGASKRPAGKPTTGRGGAHSAAGTQSSPDRVRIYGLHAVRAAIDNPARTIFGLWATRNALQRLGLGDPAGLSFPVDLVLPAVLDRRLGGDAVHQGAMIEASPLATRRLDSLGDSRLLLVLDQVTDPHNVGAIMRTAIALDAGAVITTLRHSPQESGVLAKSASGALERIPYIQITNLASALETLKDLGFWTVGLDSDAETSLEHTIAGERIALVLGAEGKGLRHRTRQTVAALARLDMPGPIKSLNVSNAAAIALYAARRYLDGPST